MITASSVKEGVEETYDTLRTRFKPLTKEQLVEFVDKNAAELLTWPMAMVLELKDKYSRLVGEGEWPLAS